ncbi:MAG: hypothetical protein RLZZ292_3834 [Bacteroidota bacterium]|jgi:acyl-ACP thioesterase
MEALHKEKFSIPSFLIDPNRQLTTQGLLQLFQDISYAHVRAGGFDDATMQDLGSFWVLNRLRLHINALPKWCDNVTVQTWVSRSTPPFFIRNYQLINDLGEELAHACSLWILIDANTRKPIRNFDTQNFPYLPDQHAACGLPEKLKLPNNPAKFSSEYFVRHSDLDIASHLNNTKYIALALDTLPEATFYPNLEINYNQEVVLNDTLTIQAIEHAEQLFFKIEKNGAVVCSLKLY